MLDVLNILDVLGVKGKQRVYSSLTDVLMPIYQAYYSPIYYIICSHPFDVLFRLSPEETIVVNCNIPHSNGLIPEYYMFKISTGGEEIDGQWHTIMDLYNIDTTPAEPVFTKDITEYLPNISKENPYIKLYTLDAAILEFSALGSSSLNRMCTVAVVDVAGTKSYYPVALWFNDESKDIATKITIFYIQQFGVTVSEVLYMTVAEALELYKTNPA